MDNKKYNFDKLSPFGDDPVLRDLYYAMDRVIELLGTHGDTIEDLRKKYMNETNVTLIPYQEDAFKELNKQLEKITMKNLKELNPEDFFTERIGEEPSTPLYGLKGRLQKLLEFLEWSNEVIDETQNEKNGKLIKIRRFKENSTMAHTIDLIKDKIDTLNDILTDISKFIFSNKLSNFAKNRKFTQKEIANKLNIRQQTVSDWYRRKTLPSMDKVIQLAFLLDTSVDYLIRPDVNEANIVNDHIYKDIGLSSKSVDILRNLKEKYPQQNNLVLKTINLLIENSIENKEINLLSALSDYFKPFFEQNLYLISEDKLSELQLTILKDCNSLEEAKEVVKDFKVNLEREALETPYSIHDVSSAHLSNIHNILVRIKDNITNQYI